VGGITPWSGSVAEAGTESTRSLHDTVQQNIRIFGSVARGEAKEESDLDL